MAVEERFAHTIMKANTSLVYDHEPLDTTTHQIRLMHIVTPYNTEDSISIKLRAYDLDTAPPYIALSYAWDDVNPDFQNATYPIDVNGTSIQVGRTLYTALIELRDKIQELSEDSPLVDMPIWVDQVCIDQLNVAERNHQVAMMASIYSSAERVVVWLPEALLEPFDLELSNWLKHENAWLDLDDEDHRASIEHVSSVFKAAYWTRLWVVQEILLAKERYALCPGGILVSWNDMGGLHNHYKDYFKNEHVYEVTELLSKSLDEIPMPLGEAISRFCIQGCKDPRDKVYALQGITLDNEQVVVDYHKSVHSVFVDTVRVLHEAFVYGMYNFGDAISVYKGSIQAVSMRGNALQDHLTLLARELGLLDMGDTTRGRDQRHGLATLLKDLFRGHRNRFLLNCRVTGCPMNIGFVDEAFRGPATSNAAPDRWWIESEGERRYYK